MRPVNDKAFLRQFDESSFEMNHSLLTFKRSQKVDSSDSFCLQCFPNAFAEGAVDINKPIAVLGRKRRGNGEALSSETLRKVRVVRLSDRYFHGQDAEAAVSHHHGEVLSPGTIRPVYPILPNNMLMLTTRPTGVSQTEMGWINL